MTHNQMMLSLSGNLMYGMTRSQQKDKEEEAPRRQKTEEEIMRRLGEFKANAKHNIFTT